jgi:hypothetical protein
VYRKGESASDFLERHSVFPSLVSPGRLPFFLMLAAAPSEISFAFQYELDLFYAVGRLPFRSQERLSSYAEDVVDASRREPGPRNLATLFGPSHAGDASTSQGTALFIDGLRRELFGLDEPRRGRKRRNETAPEIEVLLAGDATKGRLLRSLLQEQPPRLLISAGHGVLWSGLPELREARQGALVCQEWSGPGSGEPLSRGHYIQAQDISNEANLQGLIAVLLACFSGGTPASDEYAFIGTKKEHIPSRSFVAALPLRLLEKGAQAVIAHVDQAWPHSFLWRKRLHLAVHLLAMKRILQGSPLGWAKHAFDEAQARFAAQLNLAQAAGPKSSDDITWLRIATNDMRGFILLGDPAVRLVR